MSGITATTRHGSIQESDNIDWITSLPFLGVHAACLAAFWTGVSWKALALCLAVVRDPHVRDHGWIPSVLFPPILPHEPLISVRLGLDRLLRSAEGSALVGSAPSASSPTFRSAGGFALTQAARLLVGAYRLDSLRQV